jgi:replicative DNA helicase
MLLLEPEAVHQVYETFEDPQVFYKAQHQDIFRAMVSMDQDHGYDLVSLAEYLTDRGHQNIAYVLNTFYEAVPSAANIQTHIDTVYEKYQQRYSRDVYREALKRLEMNDVAMSVNDWANSKIDALHTDRASEIVPMQATIERGMVRIEKMLSGDMPGYQTGFLDLDSKIQGFEPGDYIVIAGRPSQGKTAFALALTKRMLQQDIPTLFISTETKADRIGTRLLAEHVGKPIQKRHSAQFANAAGEIRDLPLYVRDVGSPSVTQLRALIKQQIHQNNIQMVVIDFIQRLYTNTAENRTNELRQVSSTIKDLGQEYGIINLVLSQLRKDAEGKIPEMGHIRESGDIEQDADKIIGIAAASRLNNSELPSHLKDAGYDELYHTTILNCCKVKDGAIGFVYLYTDPACYKYQNMEAG